MPALWADDLDSHRALVLGRLLDAYRDLHAERGFEGVTLSAVAARAGLARSAAYNYVADKHELAVAFTERELAGIAAQMAADVRAVASPPDRIRAYIAWTLRHWAQVPGAGDDLMPLLSAAQQARLRAALAPLQALLHEVVADGLARGDLAGDPEDLALVIWSTLAGLRLPVAQGRLEVEATARAVADVLLDGMVPREGG